MSKYFTHTAENINHITEMLITRGINEFKFCLENDCYDGNKQNNSLSNLEWCTVKKVVQKISKIMGEEMS